MIPHSKPWLTQNDIQAVNDCLNSGNIASGALCKQFRNELCAYLGFDYAYHLSNGTTAIYVVLKALGIGEGDEVILPTYVCKNVKDAIIHAGANPILCDIGEEWCMTAEQTSKVVSEKTKAIIVVHPLGIYCDVQQFKQFGLPIVEDCCQSFSKDVGHVGDAAVYSFNATKCLTTGEGGAICTSNNELASALDSLYKNKSIANPLSDMQSALGLTQLKKYDMALERRKNIAQQYLDAIPQALTKQQNRVESMYFRFLLTSTQVDFEHFKQHAQANGVAVRKGVDALLHNPAEARKFPNAERTINETISIPIYPSMSDSDIDRVIDTINSYSGNFNC